MSYVPLEAEDSIGYSVYASGCRKEIGTEKCFYLEIKGHQKYIEVRGDL